MRGRMHLALGTAEGFLGATVVLSGRWETGGFLFTAKNPMFSASVILCGTMAGSLFPDIDLPSSTIGKVAGPLSGFINRIFGHRGIFHAPVIYLLLGAAWNFYTSGWQWLFGMAFLCGAMFHVAQDCCTSGGVPVFYPCRKRFRFSRFPSGHPCNVLHSILIFLISAGILLR